MVKHYLLTLYTSPDLWDLSHLTTTKITKKKKIAGRNISNLRYADDTTLTAENEKELKSLLMKAKDEWKIWLRVQHSEN